MYKVYDNQKVYQKLQLEENVLLDVISHVHMIEKMLLIEKNGKLKERLKIGD